MHFEKSVQILIPKAKDTGSLKLNIEVRGRDQKLEAEAKGSRGRGRGQNFGNECILNAFIAFEALTSLLQTSAVCGRTAHA